MMFKRARVFLNNGMSIMIEKSNDPNIDYTLFVDVQGRRFKQR